MSLCNIYHFHIDPKPARFSFFDIGKKKNYLKTPARVSSSELSLFKKLEKNPKKEVSCYFSGTFLNSLAHNKDQLELIKDLVQNEQVELLGGTFHHSFSSLFSAKLFSKEVENHTRLLTTFFGKKPKGFINTIGIFSNDLIAPLTKIGFKFSIVPKIKWFQGPHDDVQVFNSKSSQIKLLLMEAKTSSSENPMVVYADKFDRTPSAVSDPLKSCSKLVEESSESPTYSLPNLVALDPSGKDLTYFFGNSLQKQIFKTLSELAPRIIKIDDEEITETFLRLSAPFHFTKMNQSQDNDIRYQHYTWLINCLTDLELKLE
ncbi:MAG: hypothetical protein AAGA66_11875 [Bacteroidota bacterium]